MQRRTRTTETTGETTRGRRAYLRRLQQGEPIFQIIGDVHELLRALCGLQRTLTELRLATCRARARDVVRVS